MGRGTGAERLDERGAQATTTSVSFNRIAERTTEGKRYLRIRCVEREVVQPDRTVANPPTVTSKTGKGTTAIDPGDHALRR